MRRMLLYIDEKSRSKRVVDWTLKIAKVLKSRVYVLYPLYSQRIEDRARELKKKSEDIRSQMEEEGWSYLYQIEDEAFEREVKVSLFLEEGEGISLVNSMVESYEIDMIVLGVSAGIEIEKLIRESKASIAIIK